LSLKGRDFLSLADFSVKELWGILEKALEVEKNLDRFSNVLAGRFFALIFEKPSTRTRVSFEVAIRQLGGTPLTFNWIELQLGRGETVGDTAKTLERYVHGIIARVVEHKTLLELAKNTEIPVVNALSNLCHPCQALSDMLTIYKLKGKFEGLKLAWVGDGNNVCHSLLIACSKFGLDISVATPKGYEPKKEIVKKALEEAKNSGSRIELTNNPRKAVENADIIYTDTFVSMGKEAEKRKRLKVFLPRFQVTTKLFDYAKKDCIFMHCLPAKRGEEVTDKVIDGPKSVVWFQAENRLHLQRGLLVSLIG
jgi:ornithine carbamoyltransferase